jgi:encapsulating protein for peroxidase
MSDNVGHDKIPSWTPEMWTTIDKAVSDEHTLTAVAAKFLTPPVPDTSGKGTVPADEVVLPGDDGILSVDESKTRTVIEIAVQFKVRQTQMDDAKTAVSLAIRAANILARAEDLLIFQGLAALDDPLFTSKSVTLVSPANPKSTSNRVDAMVFASNTQTIRVFPAEPNPTNPELSIYGENTYAAMANGYALLQEHHYGPQALIFPSTIWADAYATRTTTLDIPAITAERIKGLIGENVYGTSTLPSFDNPSKDQTAKGLQLALHGNTMDLVVQTASNQTTPSVAVVTQEQATNDFIFKVSGRFALRLKDTLAVVELDFVQQAAPVVTKRETGG